MRSAHRQLPFAFCFALLVAVCPPTTGHAQTPAPQSSAPAASETLQQLRERLSGTQKQQLDDAMTAFNAQHYADALVLLKELRDRHPRDPILAKFASEAAINTGDPAFAVATLTPMVRADADDWQASSLLVRACAETSDIPCRDAEMAHMVALHNRGIVPPALKQYRVENISAGANTLTVSTSLEPYGAYKIYARGDVRNAEGKLAMTITLESGDPDQPGFAKEFPKEAAQGMRRFSIDAYAETGLNQAGQRTQTHYTFKFLNGQPDYAALREQFLAIANGKTHPLSSRTGLVVQ